MRKIFALTALLTMTVPFSVLAQKQLPTVPRAGKSDSVVTMPDRVAETPRALRDLPDTPTAKNPRGGRDFEPGKPLPIGNTNPKFEDPLVSQNLLSSGAAIEPKASTVGVPVDPTRAVSPPDTTGDLGPNHYVQWVNLRYSVYTLTRDSSNQITAFNLVQGFPKNGNTIFSALGGTCATNNDGDPLVQYDQAADRWVLTQFAVSSSPYTQCIAVSTTPDPTGTYMLYAYSFGTDFNDFPKMGIWNDTYVITYNIFKRGRTFGGNRVCSYERNVMLAGGAAPRQICSTTSTSYASLLPADVEGTVTPAVGSSIPLLSISSTALLSWRLAVNWGTGTQTLTGPSTVAGVAAFARACSGGTCIPQTGTTNKLDSLGDRLNYRLSYRSVGGTEHLLVNHAVTAGTGTGIRWYDLNNAPAIPTVIQQGTYAPTSDFRWMGSAAMDKTGGIGIGYNISNASTLKPGIRYTGRGPNDALGSMGAETSVLTGPGSQTGTLTRWGDYSMMSVDPVDGCTMVFTTEYIPTNGSFNWSTYIHSFKLSTCQ